MDQVGGNVTGRGKFAAARIRRAAAEAGIGPDDSLTPLMEALAALPEDCEGLFEGLSGDLRQILTEAKRQASGEMAKQAAAGLPRAIDRLVEDRAKAYWLLFAFAAFITIVILVTGGSFIARYNYERGHDAGLAVTADKVKTAEGELWSAINGLSADQAKNWAVVMRENPDLSAAIPSVPGACSHDEQQRSRQFCWARLWIEPAKPPTPSEPPAATVTGKKPG